MIYPMDPDLGRILSDDKKCGREGGGYNYLILPKFVIAADEI